MPTLPRIPESVGVSSAGDARPNVRDFLVVFKEAIESIEAEGVRGDNLPDADTAIHVGQGSVRDLPLGTLTAPRALTLGVGGSPIAGELLILNRLDVSAHPYTIKDDTDEPILIVPGTRYRVRFVFDGSHYVVSSAVRI